MEEIPAQMQAAARTYLLQVRDEMNVTNADRGAASDAFLEAHRIQFPNEAGAPSDAPADDARGDAHGDAPAGDALGDAHGDAPLDLGHDDDPAGALAAGATKYVISERSIRQVKGLVVEVALKMQDVAVSTARIWKVWVNHRKVVVIECPTEEGLYSATVDRGANIFSRSWNLLKSLKLFLVGSEASVTVGQVLGISNINTKQIQNARASMIRKQTAAAKKAIESANTALETLKGKQQHDQQAGVKL